MQFDILKKLRLWTKPSSCLYKLPMAVMTPWRTGRLCRWHSAPGLCPLFGLSAAVTLKLLFSCFCFVLFYTFIYF